jgi:class 3 adenylate cyclase/CHASE2 domain-containing sensor protein
MESNRLPEAVPFWLRGPWPLSLVLAACACLWLLFAQSPLDRFDREYSDAMLRARLAAGLSPHPDPGIFLIGLEKNDLEGLSTIAAEYRTYAEIIDMTTDLGAAATAFDLILVRGGPAEAAPILAAAHRSRAVLFAEADTAGGNSGDSDTLRSFPFAPREVLAGLININPDPDGVIRGYGYARRYSGAKTGMCRPSLALAAYLASRGALNDLTCPQSDVAAWPELASDLKTLVNRTIPASTALINYRSSFTEPWDKGFKYASLGDLRRKYSAWKQSRAPIPADLPGPGSLVLVGPVAPGSGDSGPTPFGSNEPKVVVHAAALSDLLQRQMLSAVGLPWRIAAVLLLIAVLTWTGRYAKKSSSLGALWLALSAVPLLLGALALVERRIVFPAITPAALVTLCFLTEAGRRSGLVSLEKQRMRTTMAMYFSPGVLEEVLKNPGAIEPREAELTVLITDLRNFTTITEHFGTPVIFNLMNRVFEIETRAVMSLEGSMEHFLGDQFLGYWGAPREQPDASDRAMQAGRMIIEGLEELRLSLSPELAALFGFGLAIHRGKALVGNKGSRFRFDYGILGDIVNTTARAESLTKLYGVRWIVTREVIETQTLAPPHRFLDRVRVKGRANSVDLIEVPVKPNGDWVAICRKYQAAWLDYGAGRFADALIGFGNLDRDHGDRPSHLMAERCSELIASPPEGWDGAYALKEK